MANTQSLVIERIATVLVPFDSTFAALEMVNEDLADIGIHTGDLALVEIADHVEDGELAWTRTPQGIDRFQFFVEADNQIMGKIVGKGMEVQANG
jgi:SOS-response transcriptional repressor LexA